MFIGYEELRPLFQAVPFLVIGIIHRQEEHRIEAGLTNQLNKFLLVSLVQTQIPARFKDARLFFEDWFHKPIHQRIPPQPAPASIGSIPHKMNMPVCFHILILLLMSTARVFGAIV